MAVSFQPMSSLPGNLCWQCSNSLGYSVGLDPATVLNSTYQLDKFVKHTRPMWTVSGINSVFSDPSTQAYAQYVVSSAASGSVALDRFGQASFIWYAAVTVGATYKNGSYLFSNDAVKLVLPYQETKLHAYSVSSTGYNALRCFRCNEPILG